MYMIDTAIQETCFYLGSLIQRHVRLLATSVDDVHKFWLERSTSDQESINVLLVAYG